MPLTDTIARNAKPAAKTVRMFDRDGVYLEVSPRGGKWWRLKYRHAGKEKRVSLGVYQEVNLKKARARARSRRASCSTPALIPARTAVPRKPHSWKARRTASRWLRASGSTSK